jgi:hypothetical protein
MPPRNIIAETAAVFRPTTSALYQWAASTQYNAPKREVSRELTVSRWALRNSGSECLAEVKSALLRDRSDRIAAVDVLGPAFTTGGLPSSARMRLPILFLSVHKSAV